MVGVEDHQMKNKCEKINKKPIDIVEIKRHVKEDKLSFFIEGKNIYASDKATGESVIVGQTDQR